MMPPDPLRLLALETSVFLIQPNPEYRSGLAHAAAEIRRLVPSAEPVSSLSGCLKARLTPDQLTRLSLRAPGARLGHRDPGRLIHSIWLRPAA